MEHYFNVEIAKVYGIEEAIFIHNMFFWIKKNVANNRHKHDGRYWTYNSSKAFAELFPYFNEKKIYRLLADMCQKKILIKGNFNKNAFDRTTWYSLSDELLYELDKEKYDVSKMSDRFDEIKKNHFPKTGNPLPDSGEPIPYSKPNIKTDKEEIDKSISKKEVIDFDSIVSAWNEIANEVDEISSIRGLTDKRKKQIMSLLKTCKSTCEELVRFIKTLPYADDWVIGKGDRKWSIDFDWLIQNTSNWYVAGLEGNMHKKNRYEFDKIMRGEEVYKQLKRLDGFQYL